MARATWLWVGGGALALFVLGRKFGGSIVSLTGKVVQAGQEAAFAYAIPSEARPYAAAYLKVGRETGLDPFLLVALAMRESRSGAALRPPGPAGTGDFTPRTWTPTAMPPDGQGWGRGIMQLDYHHYADWLARNNWKDPVVNIRKGAEVLKGKLAFFSGRSTVKGLAEGGKVLVLGTAASRRNVAPGRYPDPRPLSGELLIKAAIAAYNTGEGNVLRSVAVGRDPDLTTATGPYGNADYGRDVLARVVKMAASFNV